MNPILNFHRTLIKIWHGWTFLVTFLHGERLREKLTKESVARDGFEPSIYGL